MLFIKNECDENQHQDYSCENKRIMELFRDFGNRPVVFIRFNPDKYTNEYGKIIQSSFKIHQKSGVPIIKSKKEWNNRLEELKKEITYNLTIIPIKEVTTRCLFYDFTKLT